MNIVRGLLSVCLACALSMARSQGKTPVAAATFVSHGHQVTYETFASGRSTDPILILLPGSSGPDAPLYRSQATFFAAHDYTVLLLHFFDAAGSRTPSDSTYQAWAASLADLVHLCLTTGAFQGRPIYVVGYSLGASVALAAGSQQLEVAAIADWYGSLPDSFFYGLQGMPPMLILHGQQDENIPVLNAQQLIRLCDLKHFDCANHIFPDQGHGFADPALAEADRRTLAFFRAHGSSPREKGVPNATAPNP